MVSNLATPNPVRTLVFMVTRTKTRCLGSEFAESSVDVIPTCFSYFAGQRQCKISVRSINENNNKETSYLHNDPSSQQKDPQ